MLYSYRVVQQTRAAAPQIIYKEIADQTVTSILFIQSVDKILVRAFQ